MRVERVVLKDHGDVALMRLEVGHGLGIEHDLAGRGPLEPGDAGERRALAAAGRAEQSQELAVGDPDVQAIDRGDLAESLGQLLERDARHRSFS